jgi:hypothetical protein
MYKTEGNCSYAMSSILSYKRLKINIKEFGVN